MYLIVANCHAMFFQSMLKILTSPNKCLVLRKSLNAKLLLHRSCLHLDTPDNRNRRHILSPATPAQFQCNVLQPRPYLPHQFTSTSLLSTSQSLAKNASTWSRLKQMVRDYWYVIIPVEIVTSVMWYGSIFFSLKSGVDIVQILSSIGVSEQTLSKLPAAGGDAGYHALAFICYKVISPVRHGLSLAISAGLVTRLEATRPGYLKTSSNIVQDAKETGEDLKEKYQEKVAESKEKYDDLKAKAVEKRDDLKSMRDDFKSMAKEKKDDLKDRYDEWKKEK